MRRYDHLSRAELVELLETRDADVPRAEALQNVIEDLRVHQEELAVQQAQLIEAQRALEASRARYADLFEFAPVGYALVDRSGMVTAVNLTLARMLDRDPIRVIGLPLTRNVDPPDRAIVREHLRMLRRGATRVETHLHLRRRDGLRIPVDVISRSIPDTGGDDAFRIAVVDVSERVRAGEERRRDEAERTRLAAEEEAARAANEAKDRFLAVMSHELRSPLTPVLYAVAAMEREGVSPAHRDRLAMIRRNVELEVRLIDDLLDVVRIGRGKLRLERQPVDVHAILRQLVDEASEQAAEKSLSFETALAADARHVLGDAVRLRQIFWNVLANAIRHTPSGGRIAVRTTTPSPGVLAVTLADTGHGIAAADLARLFEPFEQGRGAAHGGLGLGLAIARGLVEQHGGTIRAESGGPGAGSSFVVELPGIDQPDAVEPAAASRRELQLHRGQRSLGVPHILLVEDDTDNAESLGELLRLHGYDVRIAATVAEALHCAREGFDVLVSDLGLPDGRGEELVDRLACDQPVRAIALTGYGSGGNVGPRPGGFAAHFVKPVDPEALIAAINQLCNKRSRPSA